MTAEPQITLDALERANARLGEFISLYESVEEGHPHHDALGAAVVKSFEFTYELAYSAIRRYVADHVLSPGRVGQMRIPDVIRHAGKNGLIGPPEEWLIFRQRRNATSHEYFDEGAIEQLVALAPKFNSAVNGLLIALRERIE